MLLGREEERLALDRLLAEARNGRSGVLALVGEPGIGKTTLVDYAAERADGMRVLRARGVESEAEVPFAGLAELLRPALAALFRIPPPQAAALAGALALGPATAQDRFAVGAATLSLLSAFAEDAPLALLVDDAHLLDGSSAEALLFASRRLLADPIALVLAVREGEPSLLDGADLRVLHVTGLDRSNSAELLGDELPGEAIERVHRATGGNPWHCSSSRPRPPGSPACPATHPCPSPPASPRRSDAAWAIARANAPGAGARRGQRRRRAGRAGAGRGSPRPAGRGPGGRRGGRPGEARRWPRRVQPSARPLRPLRGRVSARAPRGARRPRGRAARQGRGPARVAPRRGQRWAEP